MADRRSGQCQFVLFEELNGAVLTHHCGEEVKRLVPVAARHVAYPHAFFVDVPLYSAIDRVADYLKQVLLWLDVRQEFLHPFTVYAEIASFVAQVAPIGQRTALVNVSVHLLALALLSRQAKGNLVVVVTVANHLQAYHPYSQRNLLH